MTISPIIPAFESIFPLPKKSFLTDAPVTIWTSEHVACLHSLRKVGWNFYLNHPVLNRVFGDSFMPNKNIGIYGPHMPYLKYHLRNWYLLEYLIRYFIDKNTAYKKISFEQEAYDNDTNINYITKRKHFSWIKFIK